MSMSEFDAHLAAADDAIWNAFGGSVRLEEAGQQRDVEAIVERNVSVERFEKGRSSVRMRGRVSDQILVVFRPKNLPGNARAARVILDGKRWKLEDPVRVDGDIEFLLVPEVAEPQSGGAGETFIKFS